MSNTSAVVTVSGLNLYVLPGGAAVGPAANTSLAAPDRVSPGSPVRLLKCDWRNYETR